MIGKSSRTQLIARVLDLEEEKGVLLSQANIADRIINERKKYRDSLLPLCHRCGIDTIEDEGNTLCRNCNAHESVTGLSDIWINEEKEDWRGLCRLIPPLVLPANYFIKIMMPFGGIAARALIGSMDNTRRMVSVYFDPFDRLGFCGRPYWELYPNKDGDPERFYAGEETDLVKTIVKIIESDCETMKVPENESLTEYPSEPAT